MHQFGTATEIGAPRPGAAASGPPLELQRLPPGWLLLRDCTIGTALQPPVVVPLVLLHAEAGVALLETGPSPTPELEELLRRRLEVARFSSIFAGHLPVLHRPVSPADLSRVGEILVEGFAALPPLTVPGGEAWVGVVRRALLPRDLARSGLPPLAAPAEEPEPLAESSAEGPADAAALRRPMLNRLAANRPLESTPVGIEDDPAPATAWWRRPWPWAAAGLGAGALAAGLAVLASGPEAPKRPPPSPLPAVPAPVATGPAAPTSASRPAPPAPSAAVVPAPPTGREATPSGPLPAPAPPPRATAAAPASASALVRTRANLRTGPNERATVLRVLPRGQSLRVLDRAPGGWVQVGDPQPIGWVHGSLLDETS